MYFFPQKIEDQESEKKLGFDWSLGSPSLCPTLCGAYKKKNYENTQFWE